MGIPLKSSENKYILVQKDVLEALWFPWLTCPVLGGVTRVTLQTLASDAVASDTITLPCRDAGTVLFIKRGENDTLWHTGVSVYFNFSTLD